jgi:H+/Cl- antiporter ClcA
MIYQKAKHFILYLLVGIYAGLGTGAFLHLLNIATEYRVKNLSIIWFLPVAGVFIKFVYSRWGKEVERGNHLILDEFHVPKKMISFKMAPFILFSTVLTHLFGGSAGREGTAVQISASIADNLGNLFKVKNTNRSRLLSAAMGAGFGAAIGAPLAGMIFGMEVTDVGRFRFKGWLECLIASFAAYYTSVIFRTPHTQYSKIEVLSYGIKTWWPVIIAGILFGLVAFLFIQLIHFIDSFTKKNFKSSYAIIFVGGVIISLFYFVEGSYRYDGLGISSIVEALNGVASFKDPLFKMFFSALTLGTGFKGGEFIPLVFIGTTLGSALSVLLPLSFSLLGALGFVAVFAGASNTPLACAVMAAEIFGYRIFPLALLACYLSYYCSGKKGIYHSQKIHRQKLDLKFLRK